MPGPLDHIPMQRTRMAIEKLAEAGQQALQFFEDGQWEAAALEVERAAEAVNTVRAVRRQARAEAQSSDSGGAS